MPTGPVKGFNPARKLGSSPDNKGVSAYTIASGYATAIGRGDPVKLSAGNVILGTNDAAVQGIFLGCNFIPADVNARPKWAHNWVASDTSNGTIVAHVIDDPNATYLIPANGTVAQVKVGNIYAVDLSGGVDTYTGRSTAQVKVLATVTGSLAVTGTNNAALSGLSNNDVFTIKSSVANTLGTITIVTNQTPAALLALLNAVPGISASLNASSYLVVTATDGGNVVLADSTGTPLADSTLLTTAGTTVPTVAAAAGMVKVQKVVDTVNNVLEVYLVEDALKDNG